MELEFCVGIETGFGIDCGSASVFSISVYVKINGSFLQQILNSPHLNSFSNHSVELLQPPLVVMDSFSVYAKRMFLNSFSDGSLNDWKVEVKYL